MSAGTRDSIPTSADKHRRPLKKARTGHLGTAASSAAQQAATLDALFAQPDQTIRTDRPAPRAGAPPPPDIVTNVQGSSAGAGSGEFHVYKAARRRERDRLRRLDEEVREEREAELFERTRAENETKDDARTRKNREKREKMRRRKEKAKTSAAAAASKDGAVENGGGGRARDQDVDEESGRDQERIAVDDKKEMQKSVRSKVATTQDQDGPAGDDAGIVIHDDD